MSAAKDGTSKRDAAAASDRPWPWKSNATARREAPTCSSCGAHWIELPANAWANRTGVVSPVPGSTSTTHTEPDGPAKVVSGIRTSPRVLRSSSAPPTTTRAAAAHRSVAGACQSRNGPIGFVGIGSGGGPPRPYRRVVRPRTGGATDAYRCPACRHTPADGGALVVTLSGAAAAAAPADAAAGCAREFELAQRADMESFRDYDVETFR